jgi:Ca-activated chloride channel family protein
MTVFANMWAFLLLLLPVLVWLIFPAYRETRPSVRVPFFQRLAEQAGETPSKGAVTRRRRAFQTILFVVVWCGIVTALARPQRLEPPTVREVPTRDLLLAVDLSGSMDARDFTNAEGERIDRLSAVKEVLDEFLVKRDGDSVGLIVFGSAAYVQVPFTQDLDVCRELLQEAEVRMAGPKTALGDAIGLAITMFEQSEVEERVLIALTDGNDTGSRIPPAEAARIAADEEITIHTVAVGDPASVGEEKLDEEALRDVAEVTGGRYFFAADRDELGGIYEELDRIETREVETIEHRPRTDLFHWPLAFVFVFGLVHFMISAFRFRRAAAPDSEAVDTG